MLFDVYFYRDDPVDALSAGATTGELVLKVARKDEGLEANLYERGTKNPLLSPMYHVRVIAMNNNSMVFEGTQWTSEKPNASKSRKVTLTVRWIVKHVGAPAVVDAKKLQRRSAARLNAIRASGFDPADDDAPDLPLPE